MRSFAGLYPKRLSVLDPRFIYNVFSLFFKERFLRIVRKATIFYCFFPANFNEFAGFFDSLFHRKDINGSLKALFFDENRA